MRSVVGFLALALCILGNQAKAENFGNVFVTADQSTACAGLSPTAGEYYGISVTSFATTSSNTTTYYLSFPAIVTGFVEPQYIVLTLVQVGAATTGTAQVYNNSFLNGSTPGTWSGTFSVDGYADFVITNVNFTANNGSCKFNLKKGLAIFAGG